MDTENKIYFKLLKEQVALVFLNNHSISNAIETWKGEEITLFQEDLFDKVKAKVSEKWFYTYFKNNPEKLPRIDMLNLLCKYIGHQSWNTFKANHPIEIKQSPKIKRRVIYLLVFISVILLAWLGLSSKNHFNFCFVDDLLNESIVNIPLDIKILSSNESSINLMTDSLGCFSYTTSDDYIKFVIKSPYHKTDTIVRFIDKSKNQNIQLRPDDYALMLKFYTDGNVTDWSKHKSKLQGLIADEAIIYQLHNENVGIELFSKDEFVQLLTIPTSGLKQIKVLEKTFDNGQIVKLKFIML